MSTSNRTSRNYVFTLHLPGPYQGNAEIACQWISEFFTSAIPRWSSLKYMVYQLELSESGSYHLQGYLELLSSQRITWIRTTWPEFASWAPHLEPRMGTRAEAIDYCQKEETRVSGPWSYGSDRGQGSRSDLSLVAMAVLNGDRNDTIMREYPSTYLRYGKHIKSMACDVLKSRKVDWNPTVTVFWGDPDAGKTYTCRYLAPGAYEFMNQHGNTVWWDGYEGQEDIIFSDFGKGALPFRDFKTLWDNGCQVNVKGGTTRLMPKRIWISSNSAPEEWYPNVTDSLDRAALYRRITYCVKWRGSHTLGTVVVSIDRKPNSISLENPDGVLWAPTGTTALTGLPLRLPESPVAISSMPSTPSDRVVIADNSPIVEAETGSTDNGESFLFPDFENFANFHGWNSDIDD